MVLNIDDVLRMCMFVLWLLHVIVNVVPNRISIETRYVAQPQLALLEQVLVCSCFDGFLWRVFPKLSKNLFLVLDLCCAVALAFSQCRFICWRNLMLLGQTNVLA